jgi:Circularly permutated YpsA SLOG family
LLQAPNAQRRQYDSFGIADQCRSGTDVADASQSRAWLDEHRIATLHVAGNRASQAPQIAELVNAVLELAQRDTFSGS